MNIQLHFQVLFNAFLKAFQVFEVIFRRILRSALAAGCILMDAHRGPIESVGRVLQVLLPLLFPFRMQQRGGFREQEKLKDIKEIKEINLVN